MANKSISSMRNIQDVCASLRRKYYGDNATARDYKDSFVINNAIQVFPIEERQALMEEMITEKDRAEIKVSKSVNFRSDCYEKISDMSKMLNIPEAEVLRRILYYSLERDNNSSLLSQQEIQLSSLKAKVALLKTQIEDSKKTLEEIINEIARLEGGMNND